MLSRPLALAFAGVLLAACGGTSVTPPPPGTTIRVLAAGELNQVLGTEGAAFRAAHHVNVDFTFATDAVLAAKIENGTDADAFASSNSAVTTPLVNAGRTVGPARLFAHDPFVIVVAPGNPKHITGFADLGRAGVSYVRARPSVVAGNYAASNLQAAGVTAAPRSEEPDSKAVVARVAEGKADAGIAYSSDVAAAGKKLAAVEIPSDKNLPRGYPIALLKTTAHPTDAQDFIDFLLGPDGQAILARAGYLPG